MKKYIIPFILVILCTVNAYSAKVTSYTPNTGWTTLQDNNGFTWSYHGELKGEKVVIIADRHDRILHILSF